MIFNQSRFVALKEALTELGVTGMTITQLMAGGGIVIVAQTVIPQLTSLFS